jgi:hypothetical protein
MPFEHQRYGLECTLPMLAWERCTQSSQSLLTQLRRKLIDLAASGSSSDGRNHRVSRRPLRKARQCRGHPHAQPAGLPWVCRGRISASCNSTEHPGCFRRILALSAVGLGDRLVEYRHRNPRHRGRFLLVSLGRCQTVVGRNRGSCAWIRTFLCVFSKDRSLTKEAADNPEGLRPSSWRIRVITVATGVGFISGLLANAGGFLFVPS